MRDDVIAAVSKLPAEIRSDLEGSSLSAFKFLNENLPAAETVQHVTSASPGFSGTSINSVLVITERRLIFVAPAPQVVSWRLEDITKVVGTSKTEKVGIFRVESGDSVFNLGAPGPWAATFADYVCIAGAIASLVYR